MSELPALPGSVGVDAPAAWREELARVLQSDAFAGARRIRDLLGFLVTETLAGRGDRLKEYVIGVEVLGRSADFDPRVDTNVRTEAWRLRERLQRYYATAGVSNPYRIELPRRSFVPLLQSCSVRPPVAPASGPSIPRPEPVTLALQPFRAAWAEVPGLGEALAEELALELSDHPGLRVVWAGGEPAAASSANAQWRLSGSVRPVHDGIRTLVQLVRLNDQEQLWSHGLQHAQVAGANLPRVLAQDISRALVTSPPAVSSRLNQPDGTPPVRGGVVRTLLCSGFERMTMDLESVRRRIRRVEAWLLHQPEDTVAYRELAALLAWCVCVMPGSRHEFKHLLGRCSRELQSQSSDAEVLAALGLASMVSFDWYGAVALLDAAVRADPTCSDAHVVRGLCALHMGEADLAQAHLDQACAVDGQSALAFATLGFLHFHQHRFGQAASAARHALSLHRHCEPAAVLLADAELCGGHWAEGIAVLQQARSWSGRWPVLMGRLGHVYAVTGRPQLARELLGELQHDGAAGLPVHAAIADVQLGLGDRDAALAQLDQAVRQRSLPDLLLLRSAPRYDDLRRDARFRALIDHMALPAAA